MSAPITSLVLAGELANRDEEPEIASAYNAEASASIGFGVAVAYASTTDTHAARLPQAPTDRIKGITVRRRSSVVGAPGKDSVEVGGSLSLLKRGEIWVVVGTGCAPGDRLYVRCATGGCENGPDGSDTIDVSSRGEFVSYAPRGGLAKLRVNF